MKIKWFSNWLIESKIRIYWFKFRSFRINYENQVIHKLILWRINLNVQKRMKERERENDYGYLRRIVHNGEEIVVDAKIARHSVLHQLVLRPLRRLHSFVVNFYVILSICSLVNFHFYISINQYKKPILIQIYIYIWNIINLPYARVEIRSRGPVRE